MSTDKQKFVAKLREETNYPFTRKVIDICYGVVNWILIGGIVIAIPNLVFHLIAKERNNEAIVAFSISIPCLLVFLFFWRITYEMTILIIDIADSVNHSAYVNHATYLLASKRSKDA